MVIIGDTHAEFGKYLSIVRNTAEPTLQLGDFGFGFGTSECRVPSKLKPKEHLMRGNHDDPQEAKAHPNYVGDYAYLDKEDVFCIGGGYSLDKDMRIPGKSWWPDEELSTAQMMGCQELYAKVKPGIVVSHEPPRFVVQEILGYFNTFSSATGRFLDYLWEHEHRPNVWIFGHLHLEWSRTVGPTMFRCLDACKAFRIVTRDQSVGGVA